MHMLIVMIGSPMVSELESCHTRFSEVLVILRAERNTTMGEQDTILQAACDEMDKNGIVITAQSLSEYVKGQYTVLECQEWIDDTNNG